VTALLIAAVVVLAIALIALAMRFRSKVRALAGDAAAAQVALRTKIEELERTHAIDLRILNGLSEAVVAVDRDRCVVLANERFGELFDAPDAVGKPILDIVRIVAVFEAFDRALAGKESVQRFTTRAGIAERTMEMRVLPIAADYDIAAVAVFIDVSRLERLEAIRRSFVSDFSHEVRTPLTGLRTAVETHDDIEHLTDAEAKQLRRIMSRQLARLERLVDDLSELSRIESGDLHLANEVIDVRKLVDDLCEDFGDRAAQHRIDFAVSGNGVFVRADPLRIQQALSNLIDNAMKYGGDENPIEIAVAERDSVAEIRVTDYGEGIAASEQEKIFHRFYRVDKSRSQETGGSGLGLAITKHILLQQQGTIEVESVPGHGSTFIVRLPRVASR